MPKFKYKALDRSGKTVIGVVETQTEEAAFKQLSDRRLDIFHIHHIKPGVQLFKRRGAPKRKDMARYIRQLATLLGAGVTLLEALKSLAKSNAHPALALASEGIRKDLRSGMRLSLAMERHLPALPVYVPRLAELGEATGQSAKALGDAADRMEFEDSLRNEIRTAMSYPMFLAGVGTLIVFLLFIFVVPRFDALIGSNKENLPAMSRWVIATGTGLKANLVPVLAILGAGLAGLIYGFKSPKGQQMIRQGLETIPLIRSILVRSELGNWARTVGIALDNGADLLTALRLGETGFRSDRLRRAFEAARVDIRAGRNIDDVLEVSVPDFDPLSIDLIRTGRNSGGLASMLLFIGKTEEDETRERAKRLSTLAEPIAILALSVIVGTIVVSIVMAMTSLYDF